MIHEILLYGEENAISSKVLVEVLELKDPRELTRQINRERQDGFPICATTNHENPGYYLAKNPEEFEAYIKALDRRLKNIRKTRDACQNTHDRMTGQQRMDGGVGIEWRRKKSAKASSYIST